ncbi:capsular biosynthesis protein [Anaerobacillus alkalidiazotrophicus]|uniref:Capsular biosynthesis protein n=1 Tax=Anaerobacillus alkalidiazotrophicus TaxID=472963 RepID=A0A1S2MDI2_9BACI|nr:Wzz/FepE/Etk N-terminal domain-containing protein [Anaerobacillus alkalidiazotrophicus]OIJ21735.1 capsular biosynthesis protein [Anaerobacillus alkalidiazotrophicus]
MEETISLKELFETIKKRILMIIAITVIAVGISAFISYLFLTPIYQSSTQILVNQSKADMQTFNVNDVRTNIELINTYNVIIKSPIILDKVRSELGLERSTESLNSQISVGAERNSQVVGITVQDPDPALAVQIANTVASVFQREIVSIMNVDNVSILSEATLTENPAPVKPNPTLNMAIAFVVGLMAAVGLAFLLEFLDNTIKTEKDIEKHLGISVIGAIPTFEVDHQMVARSVNSRRNKRGEEIA